MSEMFSQDREAVGVGPYLNRNFRPLAFGGHCFYVRKAITEEQSGGIYFPEDVVLRSFIVEVLAIGPRVGEKCSRDHAKKFKRARRYPVDLGVGDLAYCLDRGEGNNPGIKVSPLMEYEADPFEFLIEETWLIGKVELEERASA